MKQRFKYNARGFTLVEVLIAVLLISIATAALAASISSASRINATAIKSDKAFQSNLVAVQSHKGTESKGTLSFGDGSSCNVTYYQSGSADEALVSFGINKG